MKTLKALVFVSFALVMFSVIGVATAFAEAETEYLISGAFVSSGQLIDGEGEVLLTDHKGGIFGEEVMVLCSLQALGEVLTLNDIDITAVYALEVVDPEGAGKIPCTLQTGICGTPAIIPVNLPWLFELMLEGASPDPLLIGGGSGTAEDSDECSGIVEDKCSDEGLVGATNNPEGTVLVRFEETIEVCTRGGTAAGLLEGDITFLSVEAGLSFEIMGS